MRPKPHTQQHDHSGKGWNHQDLARMWSNERSHMLLVQVQCGTISLEVIFTMCTQLEETDILEPSLAIPGHTQQKGTHVCTKTQVPEWSTHSNGNEHTATTYTYPEKSPISKNIEQKEPEKRIHSGWAHLFKVQKQTKLKETVPKGTGIIFIQNKRKVMIISRTHKTSVRCTGHIWLLNLGSCTEGTGF